MAWYLIGLLDQDTHSVIPRGSVVCFTLLVAMIPQTPVMIVPRFQAMHMLLSRNATILHEPKRGNIFPYFRIRN